MTVELTTRGVYAPEDVHRILAEALSFPSYYGRNLDALHDCLTDITDPVTILLDPALCGILGDYYPRLNRVLQDCVLENPALSLLITQNDGEN